MPKRSFQWEMARKMTRDVESNTGEWKGAQGRNSFLQRKYQQLAPMTDDNKTRFNPAHR